MAHLRPKADSDGANYHLQLMLLEHMSLRRYLMAQTEQDGPARYPTTALDDWRLWVLQNTARLQGRALQQESLMREQEKRRIRIRSDEKSDEKNCSAQVNLRYSQYRRTA